MARQTTKQIGDFGESLAEKYLERRGWKILSRNFLAKGGEIDIIGYRFGVLAFFEVKSRSNVNYGRPADSVDEEKIQNIENAARQFLQLYCRGGKISVFYPLGIEKKKAVKSQRIDVIEVYLDKNSQKINHIKKWGSQL